MWSWATVCPISVAYDFESAGGAGWMVCGPARAAGASAGATGTGAGAATATGAGAARTGAGPATASGAATTGAYAGASWRTSLLNAYPFTSGVLPTTWSPTFWWPTTAVPVWTVWRMVVGDATECTAGGCGINRCWWTAVSVGTAATAGTATGAGAANGTAVLTAGSSWVNIHHHHRHRHRTFVKQQLR